MHEDDKEIIYSHAEFPRQRIIIVQPSNSLGILLLETIKEPINLPVSAIGVDSGPPGGINAVALQQ